MMQEFTQRIKELIRAEVEGIHTAMPGKILAFDAEKGLATVLPAMKFTKPDGSTMDYPQITGVPVLFQRGSQDSSVVFPLKAGDGCLIIIAEASIDYWLYGQETDTSLPFDMTNAVCIPGLYPASSEDIKQACSENALIVRHGNAKITMSKDGVSISAPNITVEGNLSVKGALEVEQDVAVKGAASVTGDIDAKGVIRTTGGIEADTVTANGVSATTVEGAESVSSDGIVLATHTHSGEGQPPDREEVEE